MGQILHQATEWGSGPLYSIEGWRGLAFQCLEAAKWGFKRILVQNLSARVRLKWKFCQILASL